MGYDIYRVDKNGKDIEPEPNKRRTNRNNRGADLVGPTYFRRANLGMQPLREALEQFSLGYWSDVPPWPDFDTEAMATDEYGDPDYTTCEPYMAHISATFSEQPGIALHKLASADGWWVTNKEWLSMLALFEDLPPEQQAAFIAADEVGEEFMAFARACAQCGGARVGG
jgi:hypothetical protein